MKITPIDLFSKWYESELKLIKVKIPGACCLSTIGIDGFPNARFVALKEIAEGNFIITGPVISRKGTEIKVCNKVALTFWWTETERQIRVQGNATELTEEAADKYFRERNRESQIVSIISRQGEQLTNPEDLLQKFDEIEEQSSGNPLNRPESWGGYSIEPLRIEFLEFRSTRFHGRTLYELINGQWKTKQLQP